MTTIEDVLKTGNDVLASPWYAWCPVPLFKATGGSDAAPSDDDEESWLVNGQVARVDKPDFDKQTLVKAGIYEGMGKFFADYGHHIDWEHKYCTPPTDKDPKWLIGSGTKFADVEGMPNLTTRLFKSTDVARMVRNLIHVEKASVGYSIFGVGVRDKRDPSKIAANDIRMVTLAASPKGFSDVRVAAGRAGSLARVAKGLTLDCNEAGDCRWVATDAVTLSKALTTGPGGIVQDGATGGQAIKMQEFVSPRELAERKDDDEREHKDGTPCGCKKKAEHTALAKSIRAELVRNRVKGDLDAIAAAAATVELGRRGR